MLLLLCFVVSQKADNLLSEITGKVLVSPNKTGATVRQQHWPWPQAVPRYGMMPAHAGSRIRLRDGGGCGTEVAALSSAHHLLTLPVGLARGIAAGLGASQGAQSLCTLHPTAHPSPCKAGAPSPTAISPPCSRVFSARSSSLSAALPVRDTTLPCQETGVT